MKFSKKWLEKFLDKPLPEDSLVVDKITFGVLEIDGMEKVNDDTVFDVKVLANRSHDCLSHWGLAKELSVLMDIPMKDSDPQIKDSIEKNPSGLKVEIKDKRCKRYVGAVIRGAKNGPSPLWLKQALEIIGQKSINTVVDITNYVMFSLGQPMHAFDLSKIDKPSLVIRPAFSGENISVLGGGEIEMDENDMVISSESEEALALAGVKGGTKAEITNESTDIILESASFDSVYVRIASRKRNLITESSKRFENGLHSNFAVIGMEYAIKLIEELTGGKCESIIDVNNGKVDDIEKISFSHEWLESFLGLQLNKQEVVDVLKKISCEVDGEYEVAPPWWRLDLNLREDIAEEVIRLIGLDKIPVSIPQRVNNEIQEEREMWFHGQIRKSLVELGFMEIYTSVFLNYGSLELENPLASDKAYLRDSLIPGMEKAISLNEPNRAIFGRDVLGIFEIGKVFDGLDEKWSICLGVCDGTSKKKNALELLNKALNELSSEFNISFSSEGNILELKGLEKYLPKEYSGMSWEEISNGLDVKFKPFSSYPHIIRDVSFWGENDSVEKYYESIKRSAGPLAVNVWLFDQYTKDRTSYAFRIVLQAEDRTLTDEEANNVTNSIHNILKEMGCEIR